MGITARLLWRKQQAEQVKNTYRMAVDAAREGFYMVRPVHDAGGAIVDQMPTAGAPPVTGTRMAVGAPGFPEPAATPTP